MLNNAPNQPAKFRTKNWVEINDNSHRTFGQIRFQISMLKSSLYDYSDAYIHVKETITIPITAAAGAVANNVNKNV